MGELRAQAMSRLFNESTRADEASVKGRIGCDIVRGNLDGLFVGRSKCRMLGYLLHTSIVYRYSFNQLGDQRRHEHG